MGQDQDSGVNTKTLSFSLVYLSTESLVAILRQILTLLDFNNNPLYTSKMFSYAPILCSISRSNKFSLKNEKIKPN